ncbi:MAG: hypothetical protein H6R18_254 [Proteobacteria bacterium]|nr:hypothetical protein [Pseudomonadota bacterium]
MKSSTLLFALLAAAILPAAQAADTEYSLVHQKHVRTYLLHTPEQPSSTQARPHARRPLVMVLHGGGGNAENAARMSGMSAIADREGFLVVYPNGSGKLRNALLTWNAGNCCGKAFEEQVDDVGFLNSVIDHVAQRHPVDPRRIYVTGMSNGGMMSYRLGCETPARFAAIAPVAGAMNVDCKPAVPLSVIAFHGTADEHVLYAGGVPTKSRLAGSRVDTAVRDTIKFWSTRNACHTYSREMIHEVKTEIWNQCRAGTTVELVTLEGFGHAWPGGEKGSLLGDDPTASIKASEVMWQFFKQHSH